jgi:hypothetical protein
MGKASSLEKKSSYLQDTHQKDLEFFLKESQSPIWKSVVTLILASALIITLVALTYNGGAMLEMLLSQSNQASSSEQLTNIQNNISKIMLELNREAETSHQM